MNRENGTTKPESQEAPLRFVGRSPRKPYNSPHLRSLGGVNVVTAGNKSAGGEDMGRKKPQG